MTIVIQHLELWETTKNNCPCGCRTCKYGGEPEYWIETREAGEKEQEVKKQRHRVEMEKDSHPSSSFLVMLLASLFNANERITSTISTNYCPGQLKGSSWRRWQQQNQVYGCSCQSGWQCALCPKLRGHRIGLCFPIVFFCARRICLTWFSPW